MSWTELRYLSSLPPASHLGLHTTRPSQSLGDRTGEAPLNSRGHELTWPGHRSEGQEGVPEEQGSRTAEVPELQEPSQSHLPGPGGGGTHSLVGARWPCALAQDLGLAQWTAEMAGPRQSVHRSGDTAGPGRSARTPALTTRTPAPAPASRGLRILPGGVLKAAWTALVRERRKTGCFKSLRRAAPHPVPPACLHCSSSTGVWVPNTSPCQAHSVPAGR